MPKRNRKQLSNLKKIFFNLLSRHKIITALVLAALILTGVTFGVGRYYAQKHSNEPYTIGTTFIPAYARYFELDPKQTLRAIIDDLGIKNIRLVSYWSDIEKNRGTYDFNQLDWQFKMAEEKNVKVSLAIGLRQPRWPECHMPNWAENLPREKWYPELKKKMKAVVERYKDSPALESYQLENEFLLKVFGTCPDHDRERLIDEFYFVKSLDSKHPIIVSRSNNATLSWPVGEPRADIVAASVYKRVWDKVFTHRYFEYPLPPWFYSSLAGFTEITTNRNTIIHELQAEPWLPESIDLKNSSIEEQSKSMDADRLKDRFKYGKDTGIKQIDLWGSEWWYWRKVKHDDPSLWNVAKHEINKTNFENQEILKNRE